MSLVDYLNKAMSTLFFSILNKISIKISSDKDISFTESEYLILKGYVPGLVRLEEQPACIDIVVEHVESGEKKMIQDEGKVIIHDIWNGVFPGDLYHLLYGLVRVRLLKEHLYSVHGACVGNDDYVLIVGHSGSGKTSVLLKLLQSSETKIFSGNKTVVSFDSATGPIAIAGTPTITIRGNDQKKLIDLKINDHVEYWGRYAFMLDPDKYPKETSVPIKAIVIVRLNDFDEERKKLDPSSSLHSLYPYFLDVVNADVVMAGLSDVFMGAPSQDEGLYLVSHLKKVLETIPVYSLIGSSSFVVDEILKL